MEGNAIIGLYKFVQGEIDIMAATVEKTEKEFEVFADITLPVSIKLKGETLEQAIEEAMSKLHEDVILQAMLTLTTASGKVIQPHVHDWFVKFGNVVKEDDNK